ncbi:hypothetical protein E2C01_081746 [Portunus trituberculatus]|uniref:Uncharacterized protein n=1 Tax=Portunus trituberculatus TaxID=210409 RepID=A0A5B7IZP3_PORTR|nr:hypothetical protein [Portunus trituberculatus]
MGAWCRGAGATWAWRWAGLG